MRISKRLKGRFFRLVPRDGVLLDDVHLRTARRHGRVFCNHRNKTTACWAVVLMVEMAGFAPASGSERLIGATGLYTSNFPPEADPPKAETGRAL